MNRQANCICRYNNILIKPIILILILNLYLLNVRCSSVEKESLSVTYVANCGFLIESGTKKILVDALFKEGYNRYEIPDSGTRILLTSNKEPFNNIDLILITHSHADHFDPEMVIRCMVNNPDAKLLCPEQVLDIIGKDPAGYEKIRSRITECTPDTFTTEKIEIDGIEVTACRLAHGYQNKSDIQNIAYLIRINKIKVFHTGDADPLQINKLTGIDLSEEHINIGLINSEFGQIKNAEITNRYIHAAHNIIMHLPGDIAMTWMEPLKEQPGLFSDPFVFTKSLEKKVYCFDTE
ncbi:MAG: MBL fold metallo-hydrolase [Bacteroidales bacterium]|nr:MBL fold metallo-hydrolase [Bacteroidales bacterium]